MPAKTFPAAWALTPTESKYLTALRPGKIVGVSALAKLHARIPAGTDPTGRVRKTMRQLRRKLDVFDIEINTRWGEGWILDRVARAKVTEAMKG